jgi:glycerophosphoryl diester phosphodiesterase
VTPSRVLVSAHRGGAGKETDLENTRLALERAIALGVDYVELDVRRCGDGTLVLVHDDWVLVDGRARPIAELTFEEFASRAEHFLSLDEALAILAGRARVHLDLKFGSRGARDEVAAVARAVEVLGADEVLVTTGRVPAIRAVRDWSDAQGLALRAGLSVGGSVAGHPLPEQLRMRRAELGPHDRFEQSRANAVVANHWLALAGLARFARRAGLPLVVWTVDDPVSLRWWLRPGRAWLVTTNHPGRALAIRDGRIGA